MSSADRAEREELRRYLLGGGARFALGMQHAVKGYHGMHHHAALEIVFALACRPSATARRLSPVAW